MSDADPNFLKATGIDFATLKYIVGYRWNSGGGNQDEARKCFKLFDKRDRDQVGAGDIKQVLATYLDFPVTDGDIKELFVECGGNPDGSGFIQNKEFYKLYL